MSWLPIAKTVPQYEDESTGLPYSGAVLKAYENGTSTNISFATDSTGGTTVTSIALNSAGYPEVSGNIVIPHIDQDYKLSLYPTQTDADAGTNAIWTIDGIAFSVQTWVKGADVASATSLLINITGNEFDITGTTTITSFATKGIGEVVILHFDGALTLTHHSTDLVLPNGQNIITRAGDIFMFYEYSLGDWRLINSSNPNVTDSPIFMKNVGVASSVDTAALTLDLKTKSGTDPTAADRVQIAFRSSTLTTGTYEIVNSTAAATIVAPSGATLGFTAAETGLVYLYAINNAGTIELAIAKKAVFDESILHTTVAIGAGSDSDNVLYSTTLRSNVAIRLIGRIKIETGATAGEWDNAPTVLTVWTPGMKKTGDIVQVIHTQDGEVSTGTTLTPYDDTIPQNTEGDEYMTLAITPTSDINKLLIQPLLNATHTVSGAKLTMALHQDSIVNALSANTDVIDSTVVSNPIPLIHYMSSGTISSTTFKIRIGGDTAGTVTFNGATSGRLLGGIYASTMTITEIQV